MKTLLTCIFCLMIFYLYSMDSKSLIIKAKIIKKQNITIECSNLKIENFFNLKKSHLIFKKAIAVKISYNGFKPIKIFIKFLNEEVQNHTHFLFKHAESLPHFFFKYQILFHETGMPIPETGEIFQMNSRYANPLLEENLYLDIAVDHLTLLNMKAGSYCSKLTFIIKELD